MPSVADYSLDKLLAMSDDELSQVLGHPFEVAELRKGLDEADKLKGDQRKDAEFRIARMFTPNVYPGEIKHIVASAKRSGKDVMADCSPCSCLD